MVGSLENNQSEDPSIPGGEVSLCTGLNNPYSLGVIGDAAVLDNLDVSAKVNAGGDIVAQGNVMSQCGGHILSAKKNFDIPHPIKKVGDCAIRALKVLQMMFIYAVEYPIKERLNCLHIGKDL